MGTDSLSLPLRVCNDPVRLADRPRPRALTVRIDRTRAGWTTSSTSRSSWRNAWGQGPSRTAADSFKDPGSCRCGRALRPRGRAGWWLSMRPASRLPRCRSRFGPCGPAI